MTFTDPAIEIATYLANSSLGLTVGTNIFASRLPDQPDAAVVVTSTGGLAPQKTLLGASATPNKTDQPTFQIRVRGAPEAYATAAALAYSILGLLQSVNNQTIVGGGSTWQSIWSMQSPTDLGLDSKQRPELTFNVFARWLDPNR